MDEEPEDFPVSACEKKQRTRQEWKIFEENGHLETVDGSEIRRENHLGWC